ncbi:MAG: hypothetical protein QW035_02250 [Candidatus Anstonellales archaeon]
MKERILGLFKKKGEKWRKSFIVKKEGKDITLSWNERENRSARGSFKEHIHEKSQRYIALEDSVVHIGTREIMLMKGEEIVIPKGTPHYIEKGKVSIEKFKKRD